MLTSREYIESGILERYVLGMTSTTESKEVEIRAAADPIIKEEITAISEMFEQYTLSNALEPSPTVKPLLMATIDYTERLMNGEAPAFPPLLNENSQVEEYEAWLNRSDMKAPADEVFFAKIIGHTPKVTTAIIWLKEYAPHEVHDAEHERFLILEGTCEIIVDDKATSLGAGDYFEIPLHAKHWVKVTSSIPCKAILQRVAA